MWREGEGRELAGPTAAPSAGGVSELGPQPCGDPTPVGTPPSEAVEVCAQDETLAVLEGSSQGQEVAVVLALSILTVAL